MTVEPAPQSTAEPTAPAARPKTGIPKNPGRRELGMSATLLFPNREIVEQYYVPIIYTACRTCYSEEAPESIFRRAVDGDFDPAKMQKLISSVIESGMAPPSSTSSSRSRSPASAGRCRTSSSAIGRAWRSISRASAT